MTQGHNISDEKLNALLDNELDAEERAFVLGAMQQDGDLASRYCELRRVKESVFAAYASPPLPGVAEKADKSWRVNRGALLVASVLMLLTGSLFGWLGGQQISGPESNMLSLDQLSSTPLRNDRVIIHINSMNSQRVESVLNAAEQLLLSHRENEEKLQLEVIANEEGLGLLRQGSPYTKHVRSLAENYHNISFKACGIAKKVAALKEQREIVLLPQAQQIPAALDQILMRIKQGWTYIKG